MIGPNLLLAIDLRIIARRYSTAVGSRHRTVRWTFVLFSPVFIQQGGNWLKMSIPF